MNFPRLELVLQEELGLSAASISPAAITRAIQERMKAQELTEPALYEDLLRRSPVEMQALIELVVVPETWFFRDRESFAALARVATEEWPAVRPGQTLRLLSLPCSTGEEPYSIAMALLDLGLPPQRFQIDAVDVSAYSLQRARAGFYGKNSFRGGHLEFRDHHFTAKPPGWQIAERVRRQVHFQAGNFTDKNLLPGLHLYDAIFCRNVLIYFTAEAQEAAVDTLERLLVPNGVLFMGPSETSVLPTHRFVSARLGHAFAFRKVAPDIAQARQKAAPKTAASWPELAPRLAAPRTPLPFSTVTAPAVPPASPVTENPLDEVMQLADQGRLDEAAARCEAHIAQHGPSARAYYLFGLIHDAGRRPQEAAAFYRKALYLDPQDEEVLAQLAALLRAEGDTEGARLLLDRARRLTTRPKE